MNPGIHIDGGTGIGRAGLSTHLLPSGGPQAVSLADVLEILRWMHADLRYIHRAFGEVAKIRDSFAAESQRHLRTVQTNEKLAAESRRIVDGFYELSATMLERMTSLEAGVGTLRGDIEKIDLWIVGKMNQQAERLRAIEDRLRLPWWRKLWR